MIISAITKYEQKTGETFQFGKDPRLSLFVPPYQDEFMLYRVGEEDGVKYIWLDQMYGNMANFVPFIRAVCQVGGIDKIVTATTRNPKMHMRKWKMERLPDRDYEYEGRLYYVLIGDLENLKP